MSSEALGLEVDYEGVLDRDHLGDVGVPHSAELLAYTNAVQIGMPDLAAATADLQAAVGTDGLLEAAATIAIFNGLVRVADGTGIQLDGGVLALSADDRSVLGIDRFAGAANSAPTTAAASPLAPTSLSIGEMFGDTNRTRT